MRKEWSVKSTITSKQVNLFDELNTIRALPDLPIDDFLYPQDLEYPPVTLANLSRAVERVHEAVEKGENILVVFDVDTDGVTSGAIILQYLTNLTKNVDYIIGSFKNHGLAQYKMDDFYGFDLVIACDSLSCEYEVYDMLETYAIDIVILDHHNPEEIKPTSAIIVNSEMHNYPNPTLSGAGVAYKFAQLYDEMYDLDLADEYVDLAAVGIIADVSDLSSLENRTICNRGLHNLRNMALQKIIGSYTFNAESVSFSVAPLINACNRLGENIEAAEFILTHHQDYLNGKYETLTRLKEIQTEMTNAYIADFHNNHYEGEKFTLFVAEDVGLSGYIAQKIADQTKKPSIVVRKDGDLYRGSIRAYGLDDFKTIVNNTGLALSGGHSKAAGISIGEQDIDQFVQALEQELKDVELCVTEDADFEITTSLVTDRLVTDTEYINFLSGEGFRKITYVIRDLEPAKISTMKDKHSKFEVDNITFLLWNNTDLGKEYDKTENEFATIDVLGTFSFGYFRGRKQINFIIDDYIVHTSGIF